MSGAEFIEEMESNVVAMKNLRPHKTPNGTGSDGGGSDMLVRVAILEEIAQSTKDTLKDLKSDVAQVRSNQERDFRLLFGALITVALGLAGLMAKGFHWL